MTSFNSAPTTPPLAAATNHAQGATIDTRTLIAQPLSAVTERLDDNRARTGFEPATYPLGCSGH